MQRSSCVVTLLVAATGGGAGDLVTASLAGSELGLAILWAVKSSSYALAFPFFVVAMIPYRLGLKCFFSPRELDAVSGEIRAAPTRRQMAKRVAF